MMRKDSLFLTFAASACAVAALLTWSVPSQGQASGPASLTCTNTPPPDTNRAASPPVPTPVTSALLATALPCAENVSGNGLFKDDQLANFQRGFDFYSWLTFLALNAPADGSGIEKSKPDSKAKWEDAINFAPLLDVMLPGAAKPEWNKKTVPAECSAQYTPGTMVIEMIEETFNQPFKTGALIDQQGNYALFDILMNKQMFDYVVLHGLYSKAVQMSPEKATLKIDFPAGTNAGAPGEVGAVMIKVSWKVLGPADDKAKFHNVDALVLMPRHEGGPAPLCVRQTLGLIGYHIGHKTVGRLQWIWSSFEHVDNVPEQRDVEGGKATGRYSFYDPSCDPSKCPVNQTPPRPWDPVPGNGLKFHSAFKSQITRTIPLTDQTKDLNKLFQTALKDTVWKNYMLLSTQWPSEFLCARGATTGEPPPATDFEKQPDMTCAPAPTYLANSTLETYSQGSVPLASSSCMSCHGNAVSYQQRPPTAKPGEKFFNQSDFTFMLEKAR
jgi:hypothetical protein